MCKEIQAKRKTFCLCEGKREKKKKKSFAGWHSNLESNCIKPTTLKCLREWKSRLGKKKQKQRCHMFLLRLSFEWRMLFIIYLPLAIAVWTQFPLNRRMGFMDPDYPEVVKIQLVWQLEKKTVGASTDVKGEEEKLLIAALLNLRLDGTDISCLLEVKYVEQESCQSHRRGWLHV